MLFTPAPARRALAPSLGIGLAAGVVFLTLQAGDMTGSVTAAATVLRGTLFGHVLAAQLAALAVATLAARWGGGAWVTLPACWLALGAQVLHLHGWAMEGRFGPLVASELVHLAAAGAWLGGLVPLVLALRALPPPQGAALAGRFSWLGQVCIVALAGSAAYQGWVLLGGVRGLVGTGYGWTAIGKTVLFAAMLALAARHRLRLTPLLAAGPDAAGARCALVRSVAAESAVGLLVVLLAALLASLPPGMDMGAD